MTNSISMGLYPSMWSMEYTNMNKQINECKLEYKLKYIMIQYEQKKLQNTIQRRTLKKFWHGQFMVIMKVTKSVIMVCDMFRYQALFKMQNNT
jgi:hypothetical protein